MHTCPVFRGQLRRFPGFSCTYTHSLSWGFSFLSNNSLTDIFLSFCPRTIRCFLVHLAFQFLFKSILIVNLMISRLACVFLVSQKSGEFIRSRGTPEMVLYPQGPAHNRCSLSGRLLHSLVGARAIQFDSSVSSTVGRQDKDWWDLKSHVFRQSFLSTYKTKQKWHIRSIA